MSGRGDNGSKVPGRDARPRAPLPKRFYKAVTVAAMDSPPHRAEGASSTRPGEGGTPTADVLRSPPPYPSPTRGEGSGSSTGQGDACAFRILLDGRPARTPAKADLALPTRALAEAIAAEWEAQRDHIDAATMPLTRLANSAIDGVAARLPKVRADVVAFAANDLLCYRADGSDPLVQRQCQQWDPILAWSRDVLGARFEVATGLMPVAQPERACAAVAAALEGLDAFRLVALHVMTTLMGSALLALAHARGVLTAEAAWAAAHVDEDWQIGRWGEDADAAARRARRWAEMQAASRLLALLA
jgi:chaperone required for assembly of F1-ATPase